VEPRWFASQQKARKGRSKIKTMLIDFFDIRGMVHHEFVPQGQTINAEFYVEVSKRLRERMRRVRPELWAEKNWILHHDNAPSHSALTVREFFAKNDMITTDHPSNSPDLAPCDFFMFPKVRTIMRGEHFEDIENIRSETKRLLKNLTSQDM
jgi:hypothetical protein